MIICDRCNREISENAYVCDFCGKVTIAGKKMGLGPKDYSILLGIFGLLISLFIPLITWGFKVGYKQAKENLIIKVLQSICCNNNLNNFYDLLLIPVFLKIN